MTRTRIVATVGPSTETEQKLRALVDAGVNVFRLNASHSNPARMTPVVESIRLVAGASPVAILLDLCGPKMRLTHPVEGQPGDIVPLELPSTVVPGDPVLLADGQMQLEVVDDRHSRVITGGSLPAGKGIVLPSTRLDMPPVTDKDREDLDFARRAGLDFVALSYVRTAADLDEVRDAGIPVIAKIENAQALDNMQSIVEAADGVMVARGDLGVEVAIERVPVVQKEIIALANQLGKPVITATQMLRSMVDAPSPTRAEATDVANAVLDGTDAVMLSEETAVGRYPVEAVRAMRRIITEAERILPSRTTLEATGDPAYIARIAVETAQQVGAEAIVVPTKSGFTARQVARFRPSMPLVAITPSVAVRRRLSLVWGVTTLNAPTYEDKGAEALLWHATEPVRAAGLVQPGGKIVVTAGWPLALGGITNLVHIAQM